MVDKLLVDIMEAEGIDFVLSLPCNLLSGILSEIRKRPIEHIPVCREEEGVGIAAGAVLGGRKPILVMQNSGLGNSINALMSLTYLYKLPLFILMSLRGDKAEEVLAQVPMGTKTPLLLEALKINFMTVKNKHDLRLLGPFIRKTFERNLINAAFLSRELWHAEN